MHRERQQFHTAPYIRAHVLCHQISQFLKTLELDLEHGVAGRLDSLLGQCMYFGLSFSRVGADFRGLLPPLFQAASLKTFTHAIHSVTKRCVFPRFFLT